ncbi:MAG TPA: FAD-dependent oxidoreductase [Candidatus Paceibacterota bacterium]|nr:FAD-dependent oxidoreductase [Candidatus Paceibacterota bacterium]
MKLSLVEKRKEAGDAVSFVFKPAAPFSWQAGQFLHYTLPHANPDDRKTERYFTISAAPFENRVMLTTRLVEKKSTFKEALSALPVGGAIEADGLEGDFVVDDPTAGLILIAGGIGITPFRAILLDLDKKGVPINATLLYANRDNDFVYKDELEALARKHTNFKIHYFVTPEKIDEQAIRNAAPDLSKPVFYVSGPEPMVEAFEKMMLGMGITEPHLKRDYFPGYNWP